MRPPFLSSRITRLILDSPYLRHLVLPEGSESSPYEILDYQASLVLEDVRGRRATFKRRQVVRFTQDGVGAILDHAWGNGVLVTNYHHSAGSLADTFKDEGTRHLLIELKRPMAQGQILKFSVERTAMEAFTASAGSVETTIDHPIARLTRQVIFPKGRPAQQAMLIGVGKLTPLPIKRLWDGRTAVRVAISDPEPNSPYVVRWTW